MARRVRAYHHGDLRRSLLEAALERIGTGGSEAVNLRELARTLGVSHAAPYRHFRDKEELLSAIASEGFERLGAAVAEAAARGRTPLGRLRRAGAAYVEFARAHAAHFRIMFGPDHVRAREGTGPGAFEGLLGLVIACQASGDMRPGDPADLARVAWSLVHGIAELVASGQLGLDAPADVERFTFRAVDALTAGLAGGA